MTVKQVCLIFAILVYKPSHQQIIEGSECFDKDAVEPGTCEMYWLCAHSPGRHPKWMAIRCPEGARVNEELYCVLGNCEDYPPKDWEFPCEKYAVTGENSQLGFQDPWDCNAYWWCFLQEEGDFIPWKYDCPSNQFFSNDIQECMDVAACPEAKINRQLIKEAWPGIDF